MISPAQPANPNQFGGQRPTGYGSGGSQYSLYGAQPGPHSGYGGFPGYGQGGYPGYQAPTPARSAYPGVGGAGAPAMSTGATAIAGSPASGAVRTATPAGSGGGGYAMNSGQPANPYTQSGNGPAGQAYGQSGAMPSQYMPNFGGGVPVQQDYGFNNPLTGGGYPFSSAPAAGGGSNGIANVQSLVGPPVLPSTPQQISTYPNFQADQTFSQTGGAPYQMLQHGPGASQGMLPSASTQALAAPALADAATNANLARQQGAYDLANQNANALLQWQGLGAGSDINQMNNLAGLNNAEQNYLLGQYGNNVGLQTGMLGIYAPLMSGMIGNTMGMAGNMLGGIGNSLSGYMDPSSIMSGLGNSNLLDPSALASNVTTPNMNSLIDPTGLLGSLGIG